MQAVTDTQLYDTDRVPVPTKLATYLLVRKWDMVENHGINAAVVDEEPYSNFQGS
jgi:hypothetical protein